MNLILFNFESNNDSQALGFTLDWVNKISKNVNKLYVISLRCGEYKVNDNVTVFCINQDEKSRLATIVSILRTLLSIHKQDKNISGYFVHMAHYFVPIIYPLAKFFKQKIVLWYAHKSIPFSLKVAGKLSDKIFSISSQSMRLKTVKFEAVGHGIDTAKRFVLKDKFSSKIKNIITVGRISKIKNIDMVVKSFISLNRGDLFLYIVGDTLVEEDSMYLMNIKKTIPFSLEKNVIFTGSITFNELPNTYNKMDLAINISDTGSLDKAIIEPMAMGIPIITSNDSAKEIFAHIDSKGIYLLNNKIELEKVLRTIVLNNPSFNREVLRNEVVQKHSLDNLAKKIVSEFK